MVKQPFLIDTLVGIVQGSILSSMAFFLYIIDVILTAYPEEQIASIAPTCQIDAHKEPDCSTLMTYMHV